jgi:hypothetical protein
MPTKDELEEAIELLELLRMIVDVVEDSLTPEELNKIAPALTDLRAGGFPR